VHDKAGYAWDHRWCRALLTAVPGSLRAQKNISPTTLLTMSTPTRKRPGCSGVKCNKAPPRDSATGPSAAVQRAVGHRCSAANQLKSARWLASRECEMRNLWLACACCAAALAFSYSPPPEPSWLPSLGISHAAAQVFPGHYRRVARRSYRRAARYSAYVAGSTAGYYGNPYGYGYGGGFGGYSYGGYGGYAYPYSTSYYGGYSTSGVYRRAYRRAY